MPEDFTDSERGTLRSLAEMFGEKDDRDALRRIVADGGTLKEIILAYRTQKMVIGTLKAIGGLIVLAGAAFAALKGFGLWSGK